MRQSRQYRKWTPDERGMLAMLWQTVMPVSEIASILDRTETSMQQQASLMRINRPHKRPHRKKDWTREEDAFLIKARAEGKQYVDIHMEGRNASQMKNRIGHLRRKGALPTARRVVALASRLRAWGENDPDPDFFQGDILSALLADCRDAAKALSRKGAS